MITSDNDGPGTSTPCHSDSVPNSEVCGSAANCSTSAAVPSSPGRAPGCPTAPASPRRPRGGPHRGEQAEGAAAAHSTSSWFRRVAREPRRRRGRAVAGGPRRTESRTWGSRTATRRPGRSSADRPPNPQASAIASNDPPTVRVAEVRTAVADPNRCSRSGAATESRATRRTGFGAAARCSSWSSQTMSVRSGMAGP